MDSHKPIEEFDFFLDFEAVSDEIWEIVHSWRVLAQDTVGKQLIRSIDSVGANLAEGDGRYSAADGLRHFVIARGSAREAALWIARAHRRGLLAEEQAADLSARIESALKRLNGLMNYRRKQGNFVKEPMTEYDAGGSGVADST